MHERLAGMSQHEVRLLTLLSLLQGPRPRTGAELAERMAVTPRTVRNDVERLRELGYSIHSTRGSVGGYRLGEGGTALPPILLDAEEATAVAVGLRTGVNCIIGGMEETSIRALAKLEQTLPSHLRHRIRNLNRYTVPLASNHPMPVMDPDLLTRIAGLCGSSERFRFRYVDVDSPAATDEDVEPYRLVNRQHRWHLLGYDPRAEEWKVFDVDRIEPRTPSGPRFDPRELHDEDVAAHLQRATQVIHWRHRATVTVHAPAAAVADQVVPAEGSVEPLGPHSCCLRVGAESLETIALTLARLGVSFTVDDNPELRDVVRRMAERLAAC